MATTQTFRMTRSMRLGTALLKTLLQAGIPMGPLALLSVRGRKSGLKKTPICHRDVQLVRAANTFPTWQATMPAKVIVVAFR